MGLTVRDHSVAIHDNIVYVGPAELLRDFVVLHSGGWEDRSDTNVRVAKLRMLSGRHEGAKTDNILYAPSADEAYTLRVGASALVRACWFIVWALSLSP